VKMARRHERRHLGGAICVVAAVATCGSVMSSLQAAFAVGTPLLSSRAPSAVLRRAAPTGPASGKFTLRYFDGRGVAETARMLFVLAGEEFEDKRYTISFGTPGDFSTIQRDEFDADKAAGKMDVAMGKVPVLEAGADFALPQSKAIERYLASKFGMMGSTVEEAAWVDAVAEHVRDINTAYQQKGTFFMKDQEKKKEIEAKWLGEELPVMLGKLEKALPGADGFAVGSKLSYADVLIFRLLKDTYSGVNAAETFAADCPKLQAVASKVEGNDALKQWLENRPKTMF